MSHCLDGVAHIAATGRWRRAVSARWTVTARDTAPVRTLESPDRSAPTWTMETASSASDPVLINTTDYNGPKRTSNVAFTPDTCSPDTSSIHLYPLVSLVAVYMCPVSATKLSSRLHVSTCIRE